MFENFLQTEFFTEQELRSSIDDVKYIAIGGAACKVLNNFYKRSLKEPCCLAIDIDLQSLHQLDDGIKKKCICFNLFHGLGVVDNHVSIKKEFENECDFIAEFLKNTKIAILIASLGNGTSCGILDKTLQLLAEAGCYCIIIPIIPFDFEGNEKQCKANEQLKILHETPNLVLPFYNDMLFQIMTKESNVYESFKLGNKMIVALIESVTTGLIASGPCDFGCSFQNIFQNLISLKEMIIWTIGEGNGDNCLHLALNNAFSSPEFMMKFENFQSQIAFVCIQTTEDISLNELKSAQYEIRNTLSKKDLKIFQTYKANLIGTKKASVLILVASEQKNLRTKSFKLIKKINSKALIEAEQQQFDFSKINFEESFWDTPTYLRRGIKLI